MPETLMQFPGGRAAVPREILARDIDKNLMTYVPLSWSTTGNLNANRTIDNTFALESDFDAVRLAFINDSAAGYDISAVTAAAVGGPNTAGGWAPVDAAGAAVAWTNVTFDGGGTPAPPLPGVTGTTRNITVPAAVANAGDAQQFIPSVVWSDWARINSIPPADGSRFRYLKTRVYNSAGAASRVVAAAGAEWNGVARGRIVDTVLQSGDATAGTTLANPAFGTQAPVAAIQVYSRRRGATLMVVGDSITQGFGTTGSNNCFGHVARSILSQVKKPMSLVNLGHGGATSESYYRRAVAMLPIIRPSICCIAVWTPNDAPHTVAGANLGWSRAMDLAGQAQAVGAVPVLFGPTRWFGPSTTNNDLYEPVRQMILQRLREVDQNDDMLVLDPDAVIGKLDDTRYNEPRYVQSDGNNHPSDEGHDALGRALAAKLLPIMADA